MTATIHMTRYPNPMQVTLCGTFTIPQSRILLYSALRSALRRALRQLRGTEDIVIVVDGFEVVEIDNTSLTQLLRVYREAYALGLRLTIVHPSPEFAKAVVKAGFDNRLPLENSNLSNRRSRWREYAGHQCPLTIVAIPALYRSLRARYVMSDCS